MRVIDIVKVNAGQLSVYFSYLVVLLYCHFIRFYLTCLNLINGDGGSNDSSTAVTVILRAFRTY